MRRKEKDRMCKATGGGGKEEQHKGKRSGSRRTRKGLKIPRYPAFFY